MATKCESLSAWPTADSASANERLPRERQVALVHRQQRPAPLGVDIRQPVAVIFGPPGRLHEQFPGTVGVTQPHPGDALNQPVDGRDERVIGTRRDLPQPGRRPAHIPGLVHLQRAQHHQLGIGRNRGLGCVKRGADFLESARVEGHPHPCRRKGGVGGDEFGGQGVEPHAHRLELPGVERLTPVRRHEPAAERSVARGDRVADRLGGVAVVGVPLRGPLMQHRRAIRAPSGPARAGAGRRTGGDTGTSGAHRPAGPGIGWRGRSRDQLGAVGPFR